MTSTSFLVTMAMSSCLSSFFFTFLPFSFRPPTLMSPALLPVPECLAVLSGPPLLAVLLCALTMRGIAVSLPVLLVSVPMAPVAPMAVHLLILAVLHAPPQRRAAETVLHVSLRRLRHISRFRGRDFLTVAVVIVAVVSGTAAVVNVLAPILLLQRQLTRLGLVGVVVSIVLGVHHQGPVQVGFHVATSFPWIRHLSRGNMVHVVTSSVTHCTISYLTKYH